VVAQFLADVEQGFADLAYQLAGLDERERLLAIKMVACGSRTIGGGE
jgi:hypothetical protein